MKPFTVLSALLALAAAPAIGFAAPSTVVIDFENNWAYGEMVDNHYANEGVTFTNVLGLSNDANFTYYTNAPSMTGVAMAQLDGIQNTTAFMNVGDGVDSSVSFFYSSPVSLTGAVKAYSGLNGTGDLLGVFDLSANDLHTDANGTALYDTWSLSTFHFNGVARSFDLSASANTVGFDNITVAPVPEPGSVALMLAGLGIFSVTALRRRG